MTELPAERMIPILPCRSIDEQLLSDDLARADDLAAAIA